MMTSRQLAAFMRRHSHLYDLPKQFEDEGYDDEDDYYDEDFDYDDDDEWEDEDDEDDDARDHVTKQLRDRSSRMKRNPFRRGTLSKKK